MRIDGVSSSLVRLLQRGFTDRYGGLRGFTFRVFRTADFRAGLTSQVGLFLYRVDVDQTRRHVELPRLGPHAPGRYALGLELRYLVTVWGGSAEGEQEILGQCMEILDRNAILSGDQLDPGAPWEEGDALKISLESLTNEDMLRLWDSLEPPYQLSVPYLVRTIRLQPEEEAAVGLVDSRTHIWTTRVLREPEVTS